MALSNNIEKLENLKNNIKNNKKLEKAIDDKIKSISNNKPIEK